MSQLVSNLGSEHRISIATTHGAEKVMGLALETNSGRSSVLELGPLELEPPSD